MSTHRRTRIRTHRSRRRGLGLLLSAGILLGLAGALFFWPFWQLSGQFGETTARQPSRLYGRPPVVSPGSRGSADQLSELLLDKGYMEVAGTPRVSGSFRRLGGEEEGIEVYRRRFPSPRGRVGGDLVRVVYQGNRIHRLTRDGRDLAGIWLDPPLVASYYGSQLQERRPVTLDQIPEHLIYAVLAAEDAGFLEHNGISARGVLRAAWTNLRSNEVRQGGSTLTQQLVKNLYLTHERRWLRKAREALLAIFLEARYDKRDILQAYLNEIYWGREGSINVMGIGAASWVYFGKEPAQLTLGESALLAGMIQSPANLSPLNHPEASEQRRDLILGRLDQLRWLPREQLAAAGKENTARPRGRPWINRRAPYFADAMAEEAKRRFGVGDLNDAGLILCSTLDLEAQEKAERAVVDGLEALAESEREPRADRPLQAALVSLDPATGGIRAYVGGRSYRHSQFDRARNAKRQAGSIFKPIVYAAAFDRRLAHPATLLEDAPFTMQATDKPWSPKNSDGEYHGFVTAREALEKSYNVPTAKLAVRMGLEPVAEMAERLGVRRKLKSFPALALGAMEVTPLEMAAVYSSLASGGVYRPTHGLEAVLSSAGEPMAGTDLPAAERVLNENVAFLVNQVLQGVFDRGTARSARKEGFDDRAAGKTGTTNDRRDSWFAGYSPEHATLVWVGYDDNSRTRLSGAKAALPIWTRFAKATRPPSGFRDFSAPDGVRVMWIDPRTGGQAHELCSERRPEYFLDGFYPDPGCADDAGWRRRFSPDPRQARPDGRFRRLLRILKGGGGA